MLAHLEANLHLKNYLYSPKKKIFEMKIDIKAVFAING